MSGRFGWSFLFHKELQEQLRRLEAEVERAGRLDGRGNEQDPNVQVFSALAQLMFKTIPEDPTLTKYARGIPSVGPWQFWRRATFGDRFTLYFRFHVNSKLIVYALVVDAQSKKSV